MTDPGRSELETARAVASGNAAAVAKVRRWIRAASRPYSRKLAGELDDLEQEVIMILLGNLEKGRFKGASSFRTYVRAIVHHHCIDRLRYRSRRPTEALEELETQVEGEMESPFERASARESLEIALLVAAEMSEDCRRLWERLSQGDTFAELSDALGIREGTARVRAHRCRERATAIRQRLMRERRGSEIS